MKCVKYYRQYGGNVVKISDADALSAVSSGRAMYAPKHWLKAAHLKEQKDD
tara:strand:- start:727 stop:879 length:153 start_codon:yes stop_codon:yes gene_type:complete